MNKFINYEKDYLISKIENSTKLQLISFALFMFLVITIYFIWWLPYVSRINTEVNNYFKEYNYKQFILKLNKTIGMLNMIPIKVIKENINIRKFIRELIKKMQRKL